MGPHPPFFSHTHAHTTHTASGRSHTDGANTVTNAQYTHITANTHHGSPHFNMLNTQRVAELKKEEEEDKRRRSQNFALGKEAYGCGEYAAAVKLLENSVEEVRLAPREVWGVELG